MDIHFAPEEYLSLYLVKTGARPAYKLENRAGEEKPNYKELISNIKKYFSSLYIYLDDFFGLIISKNKITIDKYTTSDYMGKILGYPRDGIPYSKIDFNKHHYGYNINVVLNFENSNIKCDEIDINIFAMVSQTQIIDKIEHLMMTFSEKLLSSECIYHNNIRKIYIKVYETYPMEYYLNKLINKQQITTEDNFIIKNFIWNIYTDELSKFNFNYDNDIHIGVLITLLLHYKWDIAKIFYGPKYGEDIVTKNIQQKRIQMCNELYKLLKSNIH